MRFRTAIAWAAVVLGLALVFTCVGPHERAPGPGFSRPAEYDGTVP